MGKECCSRLSRRLRYEIRAPLKAPAWEAAIECINYRDPNRLEVLKSCKFTVMTNDFKLNILTKLCCN